METIKSLEMVLEDIGDSIKTGAEVVEMFPERLQEYPICRGESIQVCLKVLSHKAKWEWVVYRDEMDRFFISTNIDGKRTCVYYLGEDPSGCNWKMVPGTKPLESNSVQTIVLATSLFFKKVLDQQKYPFIIDTEGAQKKTSNSYKKKKLAKQHNTVVYLGKPPVVCNSPKSKEGEPTKREFGYARRPHRRTLRHERYRNHPKYGIYKGVHVSESWCGPKEYVSKSKIYRLWQPSGIDTI